MRSRFAVGWALTLLPLLGAWAQAAQVPCLPATITYKDAKTGKDVEIAGELYFEAWPLTVDGKLVGLPKTDLVPTSAVPGRFSRIDDSRFQVRTFRGELKGAFAFDKIPVKLSESKELAQALESGFAPGLDQADEPAKAVDKPPVVLALDRKSDLTEIAVKQITVIQFKPPTGVNYEIGGRFMAFSQKQRGSDGTVQVAAATFFGGPENEGFVGAGFLADGSIVAATTVRDLAFVGGARQTVLGRDPEASAIPATMPAAPAARGRAAAAPLDPRVATLLAHYSADLKKLQGVVRFPRGSGQARLLRISAQGAVVISGMTGWNTSALAAAAEHSQTVEGPAGRGADGYFIAALSPDLSRVRWVVTFPGRRIDWGLRPNEEVLVESGRDYWHISPDGKATEAPKWNVAVRGGKMPLAVSPLDGSYYIGGDYQSGTGFEPYRNPYLHKFSADAVCKWTAWNWTGPMTRCYNEQVSDSRAVGVRFCRNGDIVVIGWSDGGNTVFQTEPYDLFKYHRKYQFMNDISAAGVGSFCHLLRMNARTMEVKAGTLYLTYLPYKEKNGKPNSLSVRDLVELGDGRFACAGSAAFGFIETPDAWIAPWAVQWAKDPATARVKGGSFFSIFDSEFRNLRFASVTPAVRNQQLAARGPMVLLSGAAAALDESYGMNEPPILVSPVQKDFGGGATDGYLMLINTRAVRPEE